MTKEGEPRRLVHFTPLRYPGGKGKLADYVKEVLKSNGLVDGDYVEPYAGGAAVALELLFQEYVAGIHINDLSKPVHAFWRAVLKDTDALCRLIERTPITVDTWLKQKAIFASPERHDHVVLGFATFFLNRTNRSGILNGGIIGGRNQNGPWKIDARFNKEELVFRIRSIAKLRKRIRLTRKDAVTFLKAGLSSWPKKTLVYLDPPYFERGRDLYYDYYRPEDHAEVATFMSRHMNKRSWLVSYDNVASIRELYSRYRGLVYSVGYSARERREGKEVMFFSPNLRIPELIGPIQAVSETSAAA